MAQSDRGRGHGGSEEQKRKGEKQRGQPAREKRADRADTAGGSRAQSPAPGQDKRGQDTPPSDAAGGEKHSFLPSFMKGKKDKDKDDQSLADGSVASERRRKDGAKTDKKKRNGEREHDSYTS